jgi:two-component system CheB/CheR fusion protein
VGALQRLLGAVPGDCDLTFVVVVHLDPDRESQLVEVLRQESALPVTEVGDDAPIEPGHVYVIPPGRQLNLTDGRLRTSAFEQTENRRHTVDHFFRSLAGAPAMAAGVVLSGGGSDGAVGIRIIKEQGGLVLVQDPVEAEHDGMPRAAIATGIVDDVLPADRIGTALVQMLRREPDLPDESSRELQESEVVGEILRALRSQVGHDFAPYKRSTVLRRIRRRMQVRRTESLREYLDVLTAETCETASSSPNTACYAIRPSRASTWSPAATSSSSCSGRRRRRCCRRSTTRCGPRATCFSDRRRRPDRATGFGRSTPSTTSTGPRRTRRRVRSSR